jgi:uncharacterized membrane protein
MTEILPFLIAGIILTFSGVIIYFYSSGIFRAPLGFRTKLSFTNMDVWRASNRFFGASLMISGLISAALGFLFFIIYNNITGIIIILIISFMSLFISFYYTDNFTKSYYDDSGYRIR